MKKRIVLDRLGNPVIEIQNKDGVFEPLVDEGVLAQLKVDELSVATGLRRASAVRAVVGRNPYQGATVHESKKLRKRSGLDYLRSLSTEIKKRRDQD